MRWEDEQCPTENENSDCEDLNDVVMEHVGSCYNCTRIFYKCGGADDGWCCGFDCGCEPTTQADIDRTLARLKVLRDLAKAGKSQSASKRARKGEKSLPDLIGHGKLTIVHYSEKAIVIRGDTFHFKDDLKTLGGKWNGRLNGGGGWVFQRSKEDALRVWMQSKNIEISTDTNPNPKPDPVSSNSAGGEEVPAAVGSVTGAAAIGEEDVALVLEDYSAKALLVKGCTRIYKDELKSLGGSWNSKLQGWIFAKTKATAIRDMMKLHDIREAPSTTSMAATTTESCSAPNTEPTDHAAAASGAEPAAAASSSAPSDCGVGGVTGDPASTVLSQSSQSAAHTSQPPTPNGGAGVRLDVYSEKAIVVRGDTRPHKDALKELGGKWNAKLQGGCGWIFPKSKEKSIRDWMAANIK